MIEGSATRVLVEQVGTVDVNCLGHHVGRVSTEEFWAVEDSLMTVFDLR